MKCKYLPVKYYDMVKDFPSFSVTGSIKGMKRMYYGEDALLVRCGSYIYNVTRKPEIYYNMAH